ncbi:RHS repeat-associated core domain-containing protein [Nannocystis punicea]|uniref:DUF1308 domain-containing protein n=1 Tax=Nannocystis punicea TaxID=2995304 RepID=A0ABY7H1L3_9BACT|nr:RHS repeat-associated core domain-containing protein [Nannocystis poenicansa]WAS93148.1 DUF1308 domain-containing protein [Nannocystis poenicansa]
MPNIPGGLTWDDDDRLQSSDSIGGGKTYYVYDGAGQRVRKVHVNQSGTTSQQRLYFGSWETYREHKNINTTNDLDLERETLHVHDDHGRVCLIETKTVDSGAPVVTPANIARYQYSNHLGTANLELDDDAEVISYEEFHPYGTSSYRAANNAIEVSAKRYRYTGQERDEETGLAYHGARYYAPWLARWTAADPIGVADTPNRYLYVRANPMMMRDRAGTSPAAADAGWLAGLAAAARATLAAQSIDVAAPDPSDVLPQKWGVHLVVAAGALAVIGLDALRPKLRDLADDVFSGPITSAARPLPAPIPAPDDVSPPPANDGNYPVKLPSPYAGPPVTREPPEPTAPPKPEPGRLDDDRDPTAPKETVNLDTGAIVAASQLSDVELLIEAQRYLMDKNPVAIQAVLDEFLNGSYNLAGPVERALADALIAEITVIPETPSDRVMNLDRSSNKRKRDIGLVDQRAFGTGDQLGITTATGDLKFVKAASDQKVYVDYHLFRSQPRPWNKEQQRQPGPRYGGI